MNKKLKYTNMHCTEGGSDKVYNIWIEDNPTGGHRVLTEYGRRGSSLKLLIKGTSTSTSVTISMYEKLIKEKQAKGYNIIESDVITTVLIRSSGGTIVTGSTQINAKVDSGFRPQLLNDIEESEVEKYLEDDDWCMEEKYDGERRMVSKHQEDIKGINRKGFELNLSINIEQAIRSAFRGKSCLLDGEDMGNKLVLFDLILLEKPFKDRRLLLQKKLSALSLNHARSLKLSAIAWTTAEKKALYKKLIKNNAEGVVFKNIHAHYTPGKPNSGGSQLKFKFCATASCIVVGHHGTKESIALGVLDPQGLIVPIGNTTIYANQIKPPIGSIVEVKYLYYYPGGSLFQPVLLGPRTDLDRNDCIVSKLKIKREEEIEA